MSEKTTTNLDFPTALKALKDGKKVTRPSLKPKWVELRQFDSMIDGEKVNRLILRFPDSDRWHYMDFSDSYVLSNDWEILPAPEKVTVKTKTIEYITCSKCKKELEVKSSNKILICEYCKNEMSLSRIGEFTEDEEKIVLDLVNLFKVIYTPMM